VAVLDRWLGGGDRCGCARCAATAPGGAAPIRHRAARRGPAGLRAPGCRRGAPPRRPGLAVVVGGPVMDRGVRLLRPGLGRPARCPWHCVASRRGVLGPGGGGAGAVRSTGHGCVQPRPDRLSVRLAAGRLGPWGRRRRRGLYPGAGGRAQWSLAPAVERLRVCAVGGLIAARRGGFPGAVARIARRAAHRWVAGRPGPVLCHLAQRRPVADRSLAGQRSRPDATDGPGSHVGPSRPDHRSWPSPRPDGGALRRGRRAACADRDALDRRPPRADGPPGWPGVPARPSSRRALRVGDGVPERRLGTGSGAAVCRGLGGGRARRPSGCSSGGPCQQRSHGAVDGARPDDLQRGTPGWRRGRGRRGPVAAVAADGR